MRRLEGKLVSCDVEGAEDLESANLWASILAVYKYGTKTESVIASYTQIGRTLQA